MTRSTGTAPVDDTAAWRQDPDHETSLLFDVFVLGQRTRALVAEAMRDAEMRPDEYAAYSVVFEAGPLTQTDLAERLGMAVTTVADFVRTMVERRHLRKRPHPTDQRAALLSLTPEGIRAHRRASRSFEACLNCRPNVASIKIGFGDIVGHFGRVKRIGGMFRSRGKT